MAFKTGARESSKSAHATSSLLQTKIRRRRCVWPTTDGAGIQSLAGEPNVAAAKTQVGQHRRIDALNRSVD
jgi:hypothetical protein